jgi:hypothetical protein
MISCALPWCVMIIENFVLLTSKHWFNFLMDAAVVMFLKDME